VSITVDGQVVASGSFLVDDETGDISLGDPIGVDTGPGGYSASITTLSGNTDPFIIFGVGATNNTGGLLTFGFAFSMPISLAEPITADASVSYSLTDGAGDGATLFPTSGTGKVVDSQDIRLSPFLSTDKGVDVGDACTVMGAGAHNCGPYTAGPTVFGVPGGPTYDLMSVIVAFGLTAHDAAGVSGRVSQEVPEPGTLLLLGAGLLGLSVSGRKRWLRSA
jgi:hypothetical protein